MRKVFLDCGGHIGESIQRFKKSKEYSDDFLIFSFEPVPHLYNRYRHWDGIEFFDYAVWVKDGYVDFFVDKTHNKASGSTMLKEKKSGKLDRENPLSCKSLDFSKWLQDNFTESDYIVLKMDIEGAEYDVLNKMIDDGSINLINKAYIEFHWDKIGIEEGIHKKIIDRLSGVEGLELLPEMHLHMGIAN
jgi:FkbM family methyltransferase